MQNTNIQYFAFLFLMIFIKSATLGNTTREIFIM